MIKKRPSKHFTEINIHELVLYTIILVFLEIFQTFFNQPFLLTIVHILLLICLLLLFYQLTIPKIGCFLLILYEIFETSSWLTIQTNITFQVINAIDFQYITKSHPEFLLYGGAGFFFVILFLRTPLPSYKIHFPKSFTYIIINMILVLMFYFSISLFHSFYPFNNMIFNLNDLTLNEMNILKAFSTKPALLSVPSKKKNLILFQIESFEKGPIGFYNKHYPQSMPFISQLAQNATIFDNLDSQPYTTWTAAGTFSALCSFPQIINDPKYNENRKHAHLSQWSKMPCIPSYLKMAGYHMFAYFVGSIKLMGMKTFLINKGYKTFDYFEHDFNHDVPMYSMVIEKVLPDLVKNQQPFVLHMANEDTHPFFYTNHVCKKEIEKTFKGPLSNSMLKIL